MEFDEPYSTFMTYWQHNARSYAFFYATHKQMLCDETHIPKRSFYEFFSVMQPQRDCYIKHELRQHEGIQRVVTLMGDTVVVKFVTFLLSMVFCIIVTSYSCRLSCSVASPLFFRHTKSRGGAVWKKYQSQSYKNFHCHILRVNEYIIKTAQLMLCVRHHSWSFLQHCAMLTFKVKSGCCHTS